MGEFERPAVSHRGRGQMMNETEIRCAIEIRQDDSRESPGRLTGTLLTYGEQSRNRRETFEAGALRWPDNGIVLRRQHVRAAPIMRVIPAVRGNQVVIDAPLPDTQAGRDASREIRDGLFTGLSVEFRAVRQTFAGGVRRITSALLGGAGLVDSPEYSGSRVEVRERTERRRLWL